MNFVVANYELNGLSRGLTIVCNLMIVLKKQLRKNKNTRYFLRIAINSIYFLKSAKQLVCFKTSSNDLRSTICYKYTFVESLQVRLRALLPISAPPFIPNFEEAPGRLFEELR